MLTRKLLAGAIVAALLSTVAPPSAELLASGDPEKRVTVSGTRVVKMVDDKFKPKSTTVPAGTKVRWVNKGNSSHTTTGSGWDSTVSPGQAFSRKFKKTGTYQYQCSFHPKMVGTLVVTS